MDDVISKTKRKQEMLALQDLGEKLVTLPPDKLQQLDLPEVLTDAVCAAKRLTKFSAIRRQQQYVGRLMRNIDPAQIIEKLDTWGGKSVRHIARLHLIERWRTRLLNDATALEEFLNAFPSTDAQRLRTLIRNACAERLAHKSSRHHRSLFKEIDVSIPEDAKIVSLNHTAS